MNDLEFGWFIGLFEGEGYFDLSGHGRSVRICIGSTDRDVLERVICIVGGKIRGPESRGKNKTMYRWSINRKDLVLPLLKKMIPHLGIRRRFAAGNALLKIELFIPKKRTQPPLPLIKHGTRSGAQVERHRKIPVCASCREADKKYQRERWAINRRNDKRYLIAA